MATLTARKLYSCAAVVDAGANEAVVPSTAVMVIVAVLHAPVQTQSMSCTSFTSACRTQHQQDLNPNTGFVAYSNRNIAGTLGLHSLKLLVARLQQLPQHSELR